jgi:hypothetical protein
VWEDGQYKAVLPAQMGRAGSVTYSKVPGAIVEIHSHPNEMLFFSATDDDDELGLGIFGVASAVSLYSGVEAALFGMRGVGLPEPVLGTLWRAGIYGHMKLIEPTQVFEGGEM